MIKDLEDITDIRLLVDHFYDKVRNDQVIGYIFNDIAMVDWPAHLPRMYSFWETVLFGKASFKGNPLIKHIELSEKTRLEQKHFDRWIALWQESINDLFSGSVADDAKSKAVTIAAIMMEKIK